MAGAVPTVAQPDGLDSIAKILTALGPSLGSGKTTTSSTPASTTNVQQSNVSPDSAQMVKDLLAKIGGDANGTDIDAMVQNILKQAKDAFGDTQIGSNAAGVRAYSDTVRQQLQNDAMSKAVAAAAQAKLAALNTANQTAAGLVESNLQNTRSIATTTNATSPETKTSQTGLSGLGKITAVAGVAAAANGLLRKGGMLEGLNPFGTAKNVLPDGSSAGGDYYGEDSLLTTDVGGAGGGGGLSLSGSGGLATSSSDFSADGISTGASSTSSLATPDPGTAVFTDSLVGESAPDATLTATSVPDASGLVTPSLPGGVPTATDLSTPVSSLNMSPEGVGAGIPGGEVPAGYANASVLDDSNIPAMDSAGTINRLAGQPVASAETGSTTDVTSGLLSDDSAFAIPEATGSNIAGATSGVDIAGGLDGAASAGTEALGSVVGAGSIFAFPLTFALGDMLDRGDYDTQKHQDFMDDHPDEWEAWINNQAGAASSNSGGASNAGG